jgi:transcriptional regulator with GAF, ATPase, and Fis domain
MQNKNKDFIIDLNSDDLFEFAKILGQQTDFQEVLRLVVLKSAQFLKADLALVLMLNPDTRETVNTIIKDGKTIDQKEYRDIHIHVGGWIINNCQPLLSHHIQKDERFAKGLFDKVPLKSVAGVPLIIDGIIIGALILLYHKSSDFINESSTEFLENMAALSAPFLRNVQKIRQYFHPLIPESSLILKYKNTGLYGKNPRFVELLQAIEAATKCDVRVLLVGKTGTGKELIAKAIHKFSSRANFPFIAIDCGAIPNTLLESELFGHKRGAFTGALSDRQGLFLEANGGTLFMDEINNLPLDMQSKLLRVLEEDEVRPVGSDKTFKTNVRIITAASTPLKKLVDDNHFREDLFYRLHVYPIYVPDLIDRQEDIPILADHFLHHFVKQQNKNAQNYHEEIIDFIKQKNWDGNVRELENFIERIVTVAPPDASIIDPSLFPMEMQKELEDFRLKIKASMKSAPLKEQMNKYEAEIVKKTLIECGWNQSEAARRLNTSEKNIRYKMEKLNIRKPEIE